ITRRVRWTTRCGTRSRGFGVREWCRDRIGLSRLRRKGQRGGIFGGAAIHGRGGSSGGAHAERGRNAIGQRRKRREFSRRLVSHPARVAAPYSCLLYTS